MPQANLASFIVKTDGARFQNELYRNVDFLLTDLNYHPKLIIEINDQTHLTAERRDRDKKVEKICEEAGIPVIKLWTSYGVNKEYIQKRIQETLNSLPVERVHHFTQKEVEAKVPELAAENMMQQEKQSAFTEKKPKKQGCYIATCVYGSYECPQVWTLRRFRDDCLAEKWYGRMAIRIYYAISPGLVKVFGDTRFFQKFWKMHLDRLVKYLQAHGIDGTFYKDR